MEWSLAALVIGFGIDLVVGDPRGFPHPVILIGRLIAALEGALHRLFPKTSRGEKAAGWVLWICTVFISTLFPALILWICHSITLLLRLCAANKLLVIL